MEKINPTKIGYYLIYHSGHCVVAFADVNESPWFNIHAKARIFKTRKEAHNMLKLTLLKYGMTRQTATRFDIVSVNDDTSYIENI